MTTPPPPTPPAISIDLPEGWIHRDDVDPFALIARPEATIGGFVPNLTVAVTPLDYGVSPEAYLARQLQATSTALADVVLLDAAADRAARQVTFLLAHATTGVDLTVAQHHRFVGDWVLGVAATVADVDWADLGPDVITAIHSVRPA